MVKMIDKRATMVAETRKGKHFDSRRWGKDKDLQKDFDRILCYFKDASIEERERFDKDTLKDLEDSQKNLEDSQKDLEDSENDTEKKLEGPKDPTQKNAEQLENDTPNEQQRQKDLMSPIAAREAWLGIIKA